MVIKEFCVLVLSGVLLLFILSVGSYWLLDGGYGEVSLMIYEFLIVLYGVCFKKNEEYFVKIVEIFCEMDDEKVL